MGGCRVVFLDLGPDVESDGFGDGFSERLEFDFCHVESWLAGGDACNGVDAEKGASSVIDGEFPDAGRGIHSV